MKRFIVLLISVIVLAGCRIGSDINNNPTSRVEAHLDGYQKLDSNVLNDLDDIVENNNYTIEQRTSYKELLKKHYRDLKYEILDEKINGNKATVEVEIEVTDYSKILSRENNQDDYKDEEGNYVEELFYDAQLDLMDKSTEKVKYTIIFYLTKTDDTWVLDNPSDANKEKIHGIYIY